MKRAEMAMAGREYWLHIKEKYRPDEETGLVIVQTNETEMADTAVRLLPVYMKRKYLKRIILILDRELATEIKKEENPKSVILVAVERRKIEELLVYHRLVPFFYETAVVSVEDPYGNANIIGKEGITLEDYVKNALYV